MSPDLVADYRCKTGENPLWHPDEKRIYWTDIPNGRMFYYEPEKDVHEQFYDGDTVGGFTIQKDGSLLLFMDRGAVKIWRDGELETVIEEIPEERNSRFNDVIADPEGRVFGGTMPTGERLGRLYRLDKDGSLEKLLEGIDVPNGLGFTPDRKNLYFTESEGRKIYLFDYDRESGEISNQRTFLETPEGEGIPDGLTVDSEGYVWSARWNGGFLARYSPEGEMVKRIEFPAKKVSSVTFGGRDYRTIYVTTAGGENKEEEGEGAGALFRQRLEDVRGVEEFRSDIKP